MRTSNAIRTACAVLLCLPYPVTAQTSDTPSPREMPDREIIERLIDPSGEDDITTLIEEIESLVRQPLCLRSATAEDVSALPFLSTTDAHRVHAVAQLSLIHISEPTRPY